MHMYAVLVGMILVLAVVWMIEHGLYRFIFSVG